MGDTDKSITCVLKESRSFPPPPEFAATAHVRSMEEYDRLWRQSVDAPEVFWAEQATLLHWFAPFDQVLDWQPPHARRFLGRKLNASYNCPDRHLTPWRS